MAESSTPPSSRIRKEAPALLLLFLGCFLLLSNGSYILPLLGGEPTLQESQANICGSIGFFIAHTFFSFFGLGALLPALILLYTAAVLLFSWPSTGRLSLLVVGISGLLISCTGLLAASGQLLLPAIPAAAGGYLGELIWQLARGFTGKAGSVLILFLLLLFSLMAAVRFSLTGVTRWIWNRNNRHRPQPASERQEKRGGGGGKERSLVPGPAASPAAEQESGHVSSEPLVHVQVRKTGKQPKKTSGSVKEERRGKFKLPPLTLLDEDRQEDITLSREHYFEVSSILTAKLQDFGVQGTVEGISPGPVVTTYEFSPAPGVKINKIVSLADDLAMVLKVDRVRIVGSIPGKAAIGIEIPNPIRKKVFLRDILLSTEYQQAQSVLSLALGFDVIGRPIVANLARMPHLLIAGATGAGKSVAINAFIASILYKASPEDVRLLLIDPKRIELSVYEDIPHLLHPVVVEAKLASRALLWAVREMERRYRLLEERRVKSIASYNELAEERLPFIVIIVDELADLMMVASKDVETSIARLAQMARAAGMHIILATQRPSVDVLTGLIKANFPTRISFKVSSKVDSRTILDGSGAEHLLGMGDMLFLPPGAAKLQRIHGAFISEQETERIVSFLKRQGTAEYDDSVLQIVAEEQAEADEALDLVDEKYDEAVAVVTETGQASISMVQRRLRVGYNRAARMIEMMEREGVVGPADGSRPREVLVRSGYQDGR